MTNTVQKPELELVLRWLETKREVLVLVEVELESLSEPFALFEKRITILPRETESLRQSSSTYQARQSASWAKFKLIVDKMT